MSLASNDEYWLKQAIILAKKGLYTTRPNPSVGCVLVKNDVLVAKGWHYRAGEPHAEIHALRAAGMQADGATAYVTLEPCSHYGKTGPCVDALIEAGIERLVYGMEDPNPLVSGRGLQRLRDAGIVVAGPLLEQACVELNLGFIQRMKFGRPWVRCKLAMSLDGRTAMANGESQWITGAEARRDVQVWRARSSAIVTGIGSVLQDNSRLTVRKEDLPLENGDDILENPPIKVVLDSTLITPHNAAVVQKGKTLLCVDEAFVDEQAPQLQMYPDSVELLPLPATEQGLSLNHLLTILAERYQYNDVLLEAGATLSGAFAQQELIDEWILYQAPFIMGSQARPLLNWPIRTMAEGRRLRIIESHLIGGDQRIVLRKV